MLFVALAEYEAAVIVVPRTQNCVVGVGNLGLGLKTQFLKFDAARNTAHRLAGEVSMCALVTMVWS
jgi:hypothetical protein